jgi:hypothetical protein
MKGDLSMLRLLRCASLDLCSTTKSPRGRAESDKESDLNMAELGILCLCMHVLGVSRVNSTHLDRLIARLTKKIHILRQ